MDRGVAVLGLVGLVLALVAPGRPSVAWGQPEQPLVPPAVLKLIIQHPALERYPDAGRDAGHGPLIVSDHLLAPGITPSRSGEPIRVLGDRDVGPRPHLRFRRFELSGGRARAVVEHKAQGMEATFILENAAGWWRVVDAQVVTP